MGQSRPVSVYRLIANGTLEERIMGLQRFKERIAESIVGGPVASNSKSGVLASDISVLDLLTGAADRRLTEEGQRLPKRGFAPRSGFEGGSRGPEWQEESEGDTASDERRVAEAEAMDLETFVARLSSNRSAVVSTPFADVAKL